MNYANEAHKILDLYLGSAHDSEIIALAYVFVPLDFEPH